MIHVHCFFSVKFEFLIYSNVQLLIFIFLLVTSICFNLIIRSVPLVFIPSIFHKERKFALQYSVADQRLKTTDLTNSFEILSKYRLAIRIDRRNKANVPPSSPIKMRTGRIRVFGRRIDYIFPYYNVCKPVGVENYIVFFLQK